MVNHIVMWKIDPNVLESKDSIIRDMKVALENLNGKIEGLIHLEVGIDFLKTDCSFDVVLVSRFECKKSLEQYQIHPLHVEVANENVKPFIVKRVVVDYEI